jgi:predicted NBD/HSP70 family sugar kinase
LVALSGKSVKKIPNEEALIQELKNVTDISGYHKIFDQFSLDSTYPSLQLSCKDIFDKTKTYSLSIPEKLMNSEILVKYLAALVNLQGEFDSVSSFYIEVKSQEQKGLENQVLDLLKKEYQGTITRANNGNPIVIDSTLKSETSNVKTSTIKKKSSSSTTKKTTKALNNSKSKTALGIDIGGTDIKVLQIKDGEIAKKETYEHKNHSEPIDQLIDTIFRDFGEKLGEPAVISVPGCIDENGFICKMPNLEQSKPGSKDLLNGLRKTKPNIVLMNDAKVVGSYFLSKFKVTEKEFVLANTLGTGLGLAIIQDGRIVPGLAEAHIRMDFSNNSPIHTCGTKGCLEPKANASFVLERAKELCSQKGITTEKLDAAKPVGQWLNHPENKNTYDVAKQVFLEFGAHLFVLYSEICRFFNMKTIDRIILTGGLARASPGKEIIKEGIKAACEKSNSGITIKSIDIDYGLEDENTKWTIDKVPINFQVALGAATSTYKLRYGVNP